MTNIEEYLSYIKSLDRPIYYCTNPGNGGDSIIAVATFQLFRKINIDYKLCSWDDSNNKLDFRENEPDKLSDIILLYAGGGNLVNNYYGSARKVLELYHGLVHKYILLPHTINTHPDLLEKLKGNVDLICREEKSFNYVSKKASNANVMLMDDLVFSLDIKDLFEFRDINYFQSLVAKLYFSTTKSSKKSRYPSLKRDLKLLIRKVMLFSSQENRKMLNCFRTDGEKTKINVPSNNIDLSQFGYGTENEAVAFQSAKKIMKFIDLFEEVRTNRLHIAIPSMLLGKKVFFYPNSYYKCQAVYEYSIKGKFSNVEWVES